MITQSCLTGVHDRGTPGVQEAGAEQGYRLFVSHHTTLLYCNPVQISVSTGGLANDRSENVEPLFRTKGYHFGPDSYSEFSSGNRSYDSKLLAPSKRVGYKNQLSVNC